MTRKGNASKAINLRLPEELYEGIERCANNGFFLSVPDFIRQTLRDRVKEELK